MSKRIERLYNLVLILGVFFLLFGCSGEGATHTAIRTPDAISTKSKEGPDNTKSFSLAPEGRKLVYTANVELVVPDPKKAVQDLEKKLVSFEAYASTQNMYDSSIVLEIRVPANKFRDFLDWIDTLGNVRRKSIQARDVTDQYYDMENRLKNKRILVDRYQTYLKNAKSVEELLNIERFLNEALAELESLEGQYRGLVKQVDYSTVTLTFESEVPIRAGEPSLGQSLKNLFASYSFVFQRFMVVLIGIFLYGIPLVVLSALLWLLLFGKIGLIRKLFLLVSAKGTEKGGKT